MLPGTRDGAARVGAATGDMAFLSGSTVFGEIGRDTAALSGIAGTPAVYYHVAMARFGWITRLRRRRTVLVAVALGLALLGNQAAYTFHVLHHVHGHSGPVGHLPAADRDCVVLHVGGVPAPLQDTAVPVLPVAVFPTPPAERRPAVPAVEAPIARAPPSLLVSAV